MSVYFDSEMLMWWRIFQSRIQSYFASQSYQSSMKDRMSRYRVVMLYNLADACEALLECQNADNKFCKSTDDLQSIIYYSV